MGDDRSATEQLIRDAFEAKDFEQAATLAVEHYGAELLGFLEGLTRDADAASEVFQQWSELFWRTLPSFEWRCSARTWAYKLARRAAHDHGRREQKHGRAQPLTDLSRLSVAVERVRSATTAYKRTDVKSQFQQLREQLSQEDQSLLTLRVDRGLQWHELAEIMLGDDASPTEQQLKAEAARLRKRFQLIRDRLRKLAQSAGLIGTPSTLA
jgi:RNA polymerase sigma-70 factor (ECF subfamily)